MKRRMLFAVVFLLVGAYSTEIRSWLSFNWQEVVRIYSEPRAESNAADLVQSLLTNPNWTMLEGNLILNSKENDDIITIAPGNWWATVSLSNKTIKGSTSINRIYSLEDLRAIHLAAEERFKWIVREQVNKTNEEKQKTKVEEKKVVKTSLHKCIDKFSKPRFNVDSVFIKPYAVNLIPYTPNIQCSKTIVKPFHLESPWNTRD